MCRVRVGVPVGVWDAVRRHGRRAELWSWPHSDGPEHAEYNFDAPEAFDTEKVVECLSELKASEALGCAYFGGEEGGEEGGG